MYTFSNDPLSVTPVSSSWQLHALWPNEREGQPRRQAAGQAATAKSWCSSFKRKQATSHQASHSDDDGSGQNQDPSIIMPEHRQNMNVFRTTELVKITTCPGLTALTSVSSCLNLAVFFPPLKNKCSLPSQIACILYQIILLPHHCLQQTKDRS